jgi:carboxylesterase
MIRLYPAPEHRPFVLGRSSRRALLVHGFPGTPWEVRAIAEVLMELGFEAHAPLLPGFGPQIGTLGQRGRSDWERSVRRAYDLVAPGASELLLVGYSMGAALVTRMAATTRSDRLILINPFTGVGFPYSVLLPVLVPLLRSYRPYLWADFDDELLREVLGRILPDLDVDDLTTRQRLRREVKVPLRSLEQARRVGAAAWVAAPTVRVPTLVVQGSNDPVVPPGRTRRFVRRLGGSVRSLEVPGGHALVWPGKPGHDEMVGEVRAFLRGAEPRRTS